MRIDTRRGTVALLVATWIVAAIPAPPAAEAFILGKATAAQKQRRDIGKQWVKLWACVGKDTRKCEFDGGHSGVECNALTETAVPPADPKGKFAAAVEKCVAKLDFAKRGSGDSAADYVAMGCPKTPVSGNTGTVDALQVAVATYVRGMNGQSGLTYMIDINCPFDNDSIADAARACVASDSAIALAYSQALLKCHQLCENDYSGKFGDGGRNDQLVCVTMGTPFIAECQAAAVASATKKVAMSDPFVLQLITNNLGSQTLGLFNSTCP